MSKSIENLKNEHQLILQVLASLDTLVHQLEQKVSIPRADIANFALFFRDFADKCHHCKEEERLFIKMNEFGFPKEHGPIAVMLSEHTQGRSHVKALGSIGEKSGDLSVAEIQSVIFHANEFIPLLSNHIGKEDNILYPMAENTIPAAQLTGLDAACETFEQQVMKPGEVDRLKKLASDLIATYPALSDRIINASACFSCH